MVCGVMWCGVVSGEVRSGQVTCILQNSCENQNLCNLNIIATLNGSFLKFLHGAKLMLIYIYMGAMSLLGKNRNKK